MKRSIVKLRSRLLALGSVGLLAAGLLGIQQGALAQGTGIVFDNTHLAVKYSPGWLLRQGVGYEGTLNGSIHNNGANNATVSLEFTGPIGTTITYFYSKAFNRGKYEAVLDGEVVDTEVSAHSQRTLRQVARTWTVTKQQPTHTIVIRVLPAPDGVPPTANLIDLDAFVVNLPFASPGTITDGASSWVRYNGAWTHQTNVPGAYAGTISNSEQVGSTVTAFAWFAFMGDTLNYVTSRAPNMGFAEVTIDGVFKGKHDLYGPFLERQIPIKFSGLGSRPHVVHIAVTGEKRPEATGASIDIDALGAVQASGSLEYFIQTHVSTDYTDAGGTVPRETTAYHVVQVNLDDPLVKVYPLGANNAVPANVGPPQWSPRGDNRQPILDMYLSAPVTDKRVLISADYFCDNYTYLCGGADPGAPQGTFKRGGIFYNPSLATSHSALLFELRRALVGRSTDVVNVSAHNAIGGGPKILEGDAIRCRGTEEGLAHRCGANPSPPDVVWQRRNGACLSRDGRMLYLMATVDGDPATWRNLASAMQSLGCGEGMQFVGGKHTGLIVDGDIKATPESAIGTGLLITSPPGCTGGVCFTSTPRQRLYTKE